VETDSATASEVNFLSRDNWGAVFDEVYTLSPSLLLNTRFGWTRFIEGDTRQSNGFDPTTLGFPASIASNSRRLLFPRINFGQMEDLGESGGGSTPFDTFQLFSTVNKVAASHSSNSASTSASSGRARSATAIRWGSTTSTRTGRTPVRAPLLRRWARTSRHCCSVLPTGGGFDLNAHRTQQANYYAFFVQDDWRARSNLTLNLGLRYERETGTTERWNRTLAGFDFGATNAVSEAARAAYARSPIPELPASQFRALGGVQFAGDGNRSVYETYPWAFSPRVGLAWTPAFLGGRTVLRGGAGVFYNTYGTTGIQQPGFNQRTPLVATQDQYLTPYTTLANPFRDGLVQPPGSSAGVNTFSLVRTSRSSTTI
jgi:outer membrane receptor protein involved in Fe transport